MDDVDCVPSDFQGVPLVEVGSVSTGDAEVGCDSVPHQAPEVEPEPTSSEVSPSESLSHLSQGKDSSVTQVGSDIRHLPIAVNYTDDVNNSAVPGTHVSLSLQDNVNEDMHYMSKMNELETVLKQLNEEEERDAADCKRKIDKLNERSKALSSPGISELSSDQRLSAIQEKIKTRQKEIQERKKRDLLEMEEAVQRFESASRAKREAQSSSDGCKSLYENKGKCLQQSFNVPVSDVGFEDRSVEVEVHSYSNKLSFPKPGVLPVGVPRLLGGGGGIEDLESINPAPREDANSETRDDVGSIANSDSHDQRVQDEEEDDEPHTGITMEDMSQKELRATLRGMKALIQKEQVLKASQEDLQMTSDEMWEDIVELLPDSFGKPEEVVPKRSCMYKSADSSAVSTPRCKVRLSSVVCNSLLTRLILLYAKILIIEEALNFLLCCLGLRGPILQTKIPRM